MPAPILSPTGTLNPNLSQSFGGIQSGAPLPPWMQPAVFQNGSGGVMPGAFQQPPANSGDNFPGGMQPLQSFGPYQNFIPQVQGMNFNPGGGYLTSPVGGPWNQMAQQMAGPMFGPPGTSALMGAQNGMSPAQMSAQTVPGYKPPSTTPMLPTMPAPGMTAPGALPPSAAGGGALGALGSFAGIGNTPLAQRLASLHNPYGFGAPTNPFAGIRPMQY